MFGNQRIRLAAAGGRHLVVVAEDGAVYTCGLGAYGMLGLGDGQPRRRLTRVPQALFSPKLGQQPAFAIRGTQGPTAGLVTPARRGPTKA
jgi:alpha-tubulin suppressor-like RCC1 family protein